MKTGKKNLLYLFTSIGLTVVIAMTGCKKNSPEINNITEEKTEKLAVEDFVKDIEKIAKLGFDPKSIEITPNGYLVEGDILLTKENLDKSVAELSKQQGQYSTRYAVTLKRDIKVALVAPSNTSKFKQAFDASLVELNSLKVSLDFIAEKDTAKADIIVKYTDLKGTGPNGVFLGYAEFVDAQGNPGKYIRLNSHPDAGLVSKPTDSLTAILSHEFGHALGLRHTDYKNRIYSLFKNNGKSPDAINQWSQLAVVTKNQVDSQLGAGTWDNLSDSVKIYYILDYVRNNGYVEPVTASNDPKSTAIHIYGTPVSPTFGRNETTDPLSLMLANAGPSMNLKFSLYDNIAFFGLYGNTAQKAHVSANLGEFGNIKVAGKTLKDIVDEVKAKK